MADMLTPLNKVRGLGSAKEGADHYWKQRVTALANVPLTIFLITTGILVAGKDHTIVAESLGSPFVAVALTALVVSAMIHMRLGMEFIIEDYVHGEALKVLGLMANTFFTVLVGLSCILAIIKLSLGN